MTNIYAHLADEDAPKSQHVTQVSFVDNSGKNINFSDQLDDIVNALANLRKLTKLQSDAGLADVITTVNAILDAIKSNA
jgi:hypothetical protein